MLLSLIVACDKNSVIGKEGRLPWRLPRDLRRFKAISLGKTVVMGRKTHQSIGRILPHRKNVVISKNTHLIDDNCLTFPNLGTALEDLKEEEEKAIQKEDRWRWRWRRRPRVHPPNNVYIE